MYTDVSAGTTHCWFTPFGSAETTRKDAKDGCKRIEHDQYTYLAEITDLDKLNFLINDWGLFDTL